MVSKLYMILLITTGVLQELHCQLISIDNHCSSEDVVSITTENSDLMNEKFETSSLLIKQQLDEAKSRIERYLDTSPALNALDEIKKTLGNLKPSECAKNLQLQFDTRNYKIEALKVQCDMQFNKKFGSLVKKIESAVNKSQSIKGKAELTLEKCGVKYSSAGCSLVSSCCQQVVLQLVFKIQFKSIKISNTIENVVTEQNYCLDKFAKEAIDLQEDIAEDLAECGAQAESGESGESSESRDSSESKSEETKTTKLQQQITTTINEDITSQSTVADIETTQEPSSEKSVSGKDAEIDKEQSNPDEKFSEEVNEDSDQRDQLNSSK